MLTRTSGLCTKRFPSAGINKRATPQQESESVQAGNGELRTRFTVTYTCIYAIVYRLLKPSIASHEVWGKCTLHLPYCNIGSGKGEGWPDK